MATDLDKITKAINMLSKELSGMNDKYIKEFVDIKKLLKHIDKQLIDISRKVQEFEIILDAAELIEDQMEEKDKYNTEWNPYDDDEYEGEDYEKYEEDEDF